MDSWERRLTLAGSATMRPIAASDSHAFYTNCSCGQPGLIQQMFVRWTTHLLTYGQMAAILIP